jgi:hypothetical protein
MEALPFAGTGLEKPFNVATQSRSRSSPVPDAIISMDAPPVWPCEAGEPLKCLLAGAIDDSGVLLLGHHLLGPAEHRDGQVLRGTLVETYNRCGPNCRCVDGPGHGPKRYLSISQPGGRARRGHVPNDVLVHVAELIDNFRKMRETLNEICAINARTSRRWSAVWRWVRSVRSSPWKPPGWHRGNHIG